MKGSTHTSITLDNVKQHEVVLGNLKAEHFKIDRHQRKRIVTLEYQLNRLKQKGIDDAVAMKDNCNEQLDKIWYVIHMINMFSFSHLTNISVSLSFTQQGEACYCRE